MWLTVPGSGCANIRSVIVVAGEALIDLVVTGEHIVATPGGAPYNVARGCARLGVPAALMATLSSDAFGGRLGDGLDESDVSTALVQVTDRPTTLAVADIDADGGRGTASTSTGRAPRCSSRWRSRARRRSS